MVMSDQVTKDSLKYLTEAAAGRPGERDGLAGLGIGLQNVGREREARAYLEYLSSKPTRRSTRRRCALALESIPYRVLCLGLETSCDETAAAVVRDGREVLSDVVSTQIDIHRRWGGVVPELASRNHVVQVMPVIDEALTRAEVTLDGPGRHRGHHRAGAAGRAAGRAAGGQGAGAGAPASPSWASTTWRGTCSRFASRRRAGAAVPGAGGLRRPHHALRGAGLRHATGGWAPPATTPPARPTTRWRKLLGLPYPGGLPIDELAQKGDPKAIASPARSRSHDMLDWSFSGLKTSVLNHVQDARRAAGPGAGGPVRVVPGGGGRRADQEAGAGGEEAGRWRGWCCAAAWRPTRGCARWPQERGRRAGSEALPAAEAAVHRQRGDDRGGGHEAFARGLRGETRRSTPTRPGGCEGDARHAAGAAEAPQALQPKHSWGQNFLGDERGARAHRRRGRAGHGDVGGGAGRGPGAPDAAPRRPPARR